MTIGPTHDWPVADHTTEVNALRCATTRSTAILGAGQLANAASGLTSTLSLQSYFEGSTMKTKARTTSEDATFSQRLCLDSPDRHTDAVQMLVIAGSAIAAEIDQIQRARARAKAIGA